MCPGFGVEAGRWLRQKLPALRAMGMDVPSVACIARLEETMPVHHELLQGAERRFLIVEDMNLDYDLQRLIAVQVCPWRVTGMDSGPCSVIGTLGSSSEPSATSQAP
jgi:kynurenine formamidase